MQRSVLIPASVLLLNLGACVLSDKHIGDGETTAETTAETTNDGEPGNDCEAPHFAADPDCDGLGLACDNATEHHNPDQLDQDSDGFADVEDQCPLIPGEDNSSDADNDGIGDACDRCPSTPDSYNEQWGIESPRMWVRNIPSNADFDQDGIGDACDNCVFVANCQEYGPDNPAPHGAEAGPDDCQVDSDDDGIGDACIDPDLGGPINGFFATGPVGFGDNDDFDQDGLSNLEDGCPRMPIPLDERTECSSDVDCGPGRRCGITPANEGQRFCNHRDVDNDGVGDACDTCVVHQNDAQITDAQLDDQDGDFIGSMCETSSACAERVDPRPVRFYDVAVGGECCVTTYPGDDVVHDPEGVPVRLACSSEDAEAGICRPLPMGVVATPGRVYLPPGCDDALADAGVSEATPLTLADVDDALDLWSHACLMPPVDQDFDGVGDACDLCPHAWDPSNTPDTDDEGVGAACAGEHAPELVPGALCEPA